MHINKYKIALFLSFLTHCCLGQIQLKNDEFNNSLTLTSNWQNINDTEQWNAEHLELFDIDISAPGQLHMMPWTSSWYQDYRGTLLYQDVIGDFIFTTQVSATNRTLTNMPGALYSLAGIMLRTPRNFPNGAQGSGGWTPGDENYVFLSVGFAANNHPSCSGCPGPHFEVKTTQQSNSNLEVSTIPTHQNVNLRIARIGDAIIILNQFPGGSWGVHRRYNRADFPDTLQIGFVTYTDWNKVNTYTPIFHNENVLNADLNPDPSNNPGLAFNPDLIGRFEYARFDSVQVPQSLGGVDLVNIATDAELLAFLGFTSQPFCPNQLNVHSQIEDGFISRAEASEYISANHIIGLQAEMQFSATDSIVLQAGFELLDGATLELEMSGCTQ